MKSAHQLLAAICLLALPVSLTAQIDEIRLPRLGGVDGGVIQFHSAGSNGRSVQVSVKDGVKTIKASEGAEKVVIVEDPNNGITVKWTQRFGPQDADKLEKTMPGLYMHLKSIPKNVDDATVDVHVDVTRDYEADDKEDLQNKHPDVYAVYEKYAKSRGGVRFGREMPMRLEIMPRVVDPAEIRKEFEKAREEMKKKMEDMILQIPEVGREFKPGKAEQKDGKQQEKNEDKQEEKKKPKRNDG